MCLLSRGICGVAEKLEWTDDKMLFHSCQNFCEVS